MAETPAFVGLGAMGAPMAANLHQGGLLPADVQPLPAADAALRGCTRGRLPQPGEAARGAWLVVPMVADDHATPQVMLAAEGVVASAAEGTDGVGGPQSVSGKATRRSRCAGRCRVFLHVTGEKPARAR